MIHSELILKPGRERPLLRRHPWIYSGAIAGTVGEPAPGDTVAVTSADGQFLAYAAYSPFSRIRARVWSWDEKEVIDETFFRRKLKTAMEWREAWINPVQVNAYRLVHAESDGMPGLIVDRYAEVCVLQILSCGPERYRHVLTTLIKELTGAETLFERSDLEVRKLEGLPLRTGTLFGPEPSERTRIVENGLSFYVDVRAGQKTGFYLDQRENRQRVKALAAGRSVLDCFAYTGAFTIYALAGGAREVVSIETSEPNIRTGQAHLEANDLSGSATVWSCADVFQELRAYRDRGRRFDMIVLDPPKFAPRASQTQKAARAYKDINLLAFKLLNPDGLLISFSCSGSVNPELFQKIVAGAALDAGVEAQILTRLSQGIDHPVALNFPEGSYLKGLICRVAG